MMKQIDVRGDHVEIRIRQDGKVVWVNVDGICACRVYGLKEVVVEDDRNLA